MQKEEKKRLVEKRGTISKVAQNIYMTQLNTGRNAKTATQEKKSKKKDTIMTQSQTNAKFVIMKRPTQ